MEAQETASKEPEHFSCPDITTLKRILRFLLPLIGQNLGSSSLMSLLCLDRVSTELGLDLEFESLWETELTSSNIILFFVDCFTAGDAHKDLPVNLAEVEELVIPAMHHVRSRKALPPTERDRLCEIVKTALEAGHALDWVSVYGEGILRVFTSGPNETILEHCRRKNEALQQVQTSVDGEGLNEAESEKVWTPRLLYSRGNSKTYPASQDDKESGWPSDDYDDRDCWQSGSDDGAAKDYTACDKECGYCGTCDY